MALQLMSLSPRNWFASENTYAPLNGRWPVFDATGCAARMIASRGTCRSNGIAIFCASSPSTTNAIGEPDAARRRITVSMNGFQSRR